MDRTGQARTARDGSLWESNIGHHRIDWFSRSTSKRMYHPATLAPRFTSICIIAMFNNVTTAGRASSSSSSAHAILLLLLLLLKFFSRPTHALQIQQILY